MNFWGRDDYSSIIWVIGVTSNSLLDFGADLDNDPDPEIFNSIFTYAR